MQRSSIQSPSGEDLNNTTPWGRYEIDLSPPLAISIADADLDRIEACLESLRARLEGLGMNELVRSDELRRLAGKLGRPGDVAEIDPGAAREVETLRLGIEWVLGVHEETEAVLLYAAACLGYASGRNPLPEPPRSMGRTASGVDQALRCRDRTTRLMAVLERVGCCVSRVEQIRDGLTGVMDASCPGG